MEHQNGAIWNAALQSGQNLLLYKVLEKSKCLFFSRPK